MDAVIEKLLSESKSHIIDYATIKSILINNGYKAVNDKISYLKQKGIIIPLKKGLYVHQSSYFNNVVSNEIIANNLMGPSYISFDYALSYYGLIPERVHELTSASTKRSKTFETAFGVFSYKQIKKELFPIGLIIETSAKGNFIIAGKEKALCDKIYFSKNINILSKKMMLEYLEDDLRIDFDELDRLKIDIIEKYYAISKSKKIMLLIKTLKQL